MGFAGSLGLDRKYPAKCGSLEKEKQQGRCDCRPVPPDRAPGSTIGSAREGRRSPARSWPPAGSWRGPARSWCSPGRGYEPALRNKILRHPYAYNATRTEREIRQLTRENSESQFRLPLWLPVRDSGAPKHKCSDVGILSVQDRLGSTHAMTRRVLHTQQHGRVISTLEYSCSQFRGLPRLDSGIV